MKFRTPIIVGMLIGHSIGTLLASPFVSAISSPSQILISELQTNAGSGYSGSEFIELYNPTDEEVSLSGWSVQYHPSSNSDCINGWSKTPKISLLAPAMIKAYGFYLLASTAYQGESDTRFTAGLSDSSGTIRLLRPDMTTSDALAWGASACGFGSPSVSPSNGRSLERRPGEDKVEFGNGSNTENNAIDFSLKNSPEPQLSNSAIENPFLAGIIISEKSPILPIKISELLIDPVSPASDSKDEFVELENPNLEPVDISGYVLKTPNSQFHLPPTIVAPGQFVLIKSANSTISLSNSGGNIQLLNQDGVLIDESAPWPKALPGASWASFANGWAWTRSVTPAGPNILAEIVQVSGEEIPPNTGSSAPEDPLIAYLPLQITELLIDPISPQIDSHDEFFELYNPNSEPIDVFGYVLKSGSSLGNSTVLNHHVINPYEYLSLYSVETGLPLSNSGSKVQLFDPAGNSIDDPVVYGSAKPGYAWVRSSNIWQWSTHPTPGETNIVSVPALTIKQASTNNTITAKKTTTKAVSKPKTQKPKKSPTIKAKLAKASYPSAAIPVAERKKSGYTLILILLGLTICYVIYEFRYDIRHTYHRLRGHTKPRT